jgi:hypothetical protein
MYSSTPSSGRQSLRPIPNFSVPPPQVVPQAFPDTPVFTPIRQTQNDGTPRKFVKWTNKYDSNKVPLTFYMSHFESHARLNEYTEAQSVDQLLSSLGLDAPLILMRLPPAYNYFDLVNAMINFYEPPGQQNSLQIRLRSMQRGQGQTARDFANKLQDMAAKAYPNLPADQRNGIALQQFMHGQNDSITTMLLTNNPSSIDAAVNVLPTFEASADAKRMQGVLQTGSALDSMSYTNVPATATPVPPRVVTQLNTVVKPVTVHNDESQYSDQLDDIVNAVICQMSLGPVDDTEDEDDVFIEILSAKVRRKFPSADKSMTCYYCGSTGHMYMQCYKLLQKLQANGFKRNITHRRPTRDNNYRDSYNRESNNRDTPHRDSYNRESTSRESYNRDSKKSSAYSDRPPYRPAPRANAIETDQQEDSQLHLNE